MIRIENHTDCCGCGACSLSCPVGCISMEQGPGGFLYPKADEGACIGCGACESACPMLSPHPESDPVSVFAAASTDKSVRKSSSSGGMFTVLASKVLEDGGAVFGASFDKDWKIVGSKAETLSELAALRGSKYSQADMRASFAECRRILGEGRKVLFVGTPCQIAGLKGFLGGDRDGLLSVDIVCHSVPSPEAWRLYLEELPTHHGGFTKMRGSVSGEYVLTHPYHEDPFMKAFLQDVITRPSCTSCPSRGKRSSADITLGDFWGIEALMPDRFADEGCSLAIAHTEKGREALEYSGAELCPVSFGQAAASNRGLVSSPEMDGRSERFFAGMASCDAVSLMESLVCQSSLIQRLRRMKTRARAGIVRLLKGGKADAQPLDVREKTLLEAALSEGRYTLTDISFRDKRTGWKNYSLSITVRINER